MSFSSHYLRTVRIFFPPLAKGGLGGVSRDMEFDREISTRGLIAHRFDIVLSAISYVQAHYTLRAQLVG